MDADNGRLYEEVPEEVLAAEEEKIGHKLVRLTPSEVAKLRCHGTKYRRKYIKARPCPCGSGKTLIKCCWHLYSNS